MEQSRDSRTLGQRLDAIREQAAADELIEPTEVREVLAAFQNHVGNQRMFDVPVHSEDLADIAFLESLLPKDPNQGQFSPPRD